MLNRHNLNIAKLAAKEKSRISLQNIYVTPEATIETDGHQLISVTRPPVDKEQFPVKDGDSFTAVGNEHSPFMMSAVDALNIAKALPKKSPIPVILNAAIGEVNQQDSRVVPIRTTNLDTEKTHMIRIPEGNFPNYERVIPKAADSGFRISMDARKLLPIIQQFIDFADVRKDQLIPVEFYFGNDGKYAKGNEKAVRMDLDGGDNQHMIALLAPIRSTFRQLEREEKEMNAAICT